MKRLFCFWLALLLATSAFAISTEYRQNSITYTLSQLSTTSTGATDSFPLGTFANVSVQCAWSSIAGDQPVYEIQISNDGSNWDTVSGTSYTTQLSSGSHTQIIDPFPSDRGRVFVTTSSGSGTLDCTVVGNGR